MIAGLAALAIRKHNVLSHWRIAVLGVDDRPKRIPEAEALLEASMDESSITRALEAVQENIHPQDVVYARADYRRAVLNALLQRSIHMITDTLQE
jgi:CO/xanthine dehydrogenase FAD-binding subunit